MTLRQLNNSTPEAAHAFFEHCCCAPRWVEAMLAARPFTDKKSMIETAAQQWEAMEEPDWLTAFGGHPRIGDVATLDKRFASTRETASREQSGVEQATQQTLEKLLRLNQLYYERFGFIFIVCASGKSAAEMLDLLQQRVENPREKELLIAAHEQWKITELRLNNQLES